MATSFCNSYVVPMVPAAIQLYDHDLEAQLLSTLASEDEISLHKFSYTGKHTHQCELQAKIVEKLRTNEVFWSSIFYSWMDYVMGFVPLSYSEGVIIFAAALVCRHACSDMNQAVCDARTFALLANAQSYWWQARDADNNSSPSNPVVTIADSASMELSVQGSGNLDDLSDSGESNGPHDLDDSEYKYVEGDTSESEEIDDRPVVNPKPTKSVRLNHQSRRSAQLDRSLTIKVPGKSNLLVETTGQPQSLPQSQTLTELQDTSPPMTTGQSELDVQHQETGQVDRLEKVAQSVVKNNNWMKMLTALHLLEAATSLQYPHMLQICQSWYTDLNFFFHAEPTQVSPQQLLILSNQARNTVSAMRQTPSAVYTQHLWHKAVQKSNLASVCEQLSTPITYQQHFPHALESINFRLWRENLELLLYKWTKKSLSKSTVIPVNPTLSQHTSEFDGKALLHAFALYKILVPTTANIFNLYFLWSFENFQQAWNEWLLPSLIYYECKGAASAHPKTLYRSCWKAIRAGEHKNLPYRQVLSPQMISIIENTRDLKDQIEVLREQAFRVKGDTTPMEIPSNFPQLPLGNEDKSSPCSYCKDIPDLQQHCVLIINVEKRKDVAELEGVVLTFAVGADRMPPKTGNLKNVQYKSPEELQFRGFHSRPHVSKRCGRDVLKFVETTTQETIGCVVYQAYSQEVLQRLKEQHSNTIKQQEVRRGRRFQQWGWGKMVAIGARIPQGGEAGDGYQPYAHMSAESEESIKLLFGHAYTSAAMDAAILPHHPEAIASLEHCSTKANMFRLGKAPGNLYYCDNYRAPQHCDDDKSWSLCNQLTKSGCDPEEISFAHAQYGIYVITESNSAWSFDANRPHGTVMASKTSSRTAKSKGSHKTIRRKDYNRARDAQAVHAQIRAVYSHLTRAGA